MATSDCVKSKAFYSCAKVPCGQATFVAANARFSLKTAVMHWYHARCDQRPVHALSLLQAVRDLLGTIFQYGAINS